jgi:hypothetical protein
MKKSELRQIIKEELRKTLNEGDITSHETFGNVSPSVTDAVDKLESFLIKTGYENDPAALRSLVFLINTVVSSAIDYGWEKGKAFKGM